MTVWCWAPVLLCCVLVCVESSAPSPVLQRKKYNNSFRLTRSTRTRVQQLQDEYKEQLLGHKHYEYFELYQSRQLKDLPLLSTDFYSWLRLTDWERLHAAFWDMQAYWNMLEWKRKQLEREDREQSVGPTHHNTLPKSIKHIQLDLRDLMCQVRMQMSDMTKQTPAARRTTTIPETSSKTAWDSHVEGYIILRDLQLYLTKLARDFLLLASKNILVTQH